MLMLTKINACLINYVMQILLLDLNLELELELCNINITIRFKSLISEIYRVNVAIESFQKGMTNGLHIKYIKYNRISNKLLNKAVRTRLTNNTYEKKLQIEIAVREIEMVLELISVNLRKYLVILNNADKMSIYELDQACCDSDKNTGYIPKIIIEIPRIIDKTYKSCDKAKMVYLINNIAVNDLNEEFNYLSDLKYTNQISIKYICMLKIHMKINTNF